MQLNNESPALEDSPSARLFSRWDWAAAIAASVFSSIVFLRHMSPEVALQDSGELITGAFTFGVPHPPGYPLWALLGYIWSRCVVWWGNPAWRIATMSVATGGLTVGAMTLMMTRGARALINSMPWADGLDREFTKWISLAAGVGTGLLFGFNRAVWLWSGVGEMRVLNVCSFIVMACVFFAWTMRPQRLGYLCAVLLIYGMSMTNHQSVAVMALAFVAGTLAIGIDEFFARWEKREVRKSGSSGVQNNTKTTGASHSNAATPPIVSTLYKSLSVFWELLISVMYGLSAIFTLFTWLQKSIYKTGSWAMVGALIFFATLMLVGGFISNCVKPKRVLVMTLLFISGCALYLYMPIASSTNPPMNWGFPSTIEGFHHAITRGQYQKLQLADPCLRFFRLQLWIYVRALIRQFSLPLCLFALVPFVLPLVWLVRDVAKNPRKNWWIIAVWVCGVFVTLLGVVILRKHFVSNLPMPYVTPQPEMYEIMVKVLKDPMNPSLGTKMVPKMVYDVSADAYILWALAMPTILCVLIWLWMRLRRPGRSAMIFIWAAFIACSLGLIMIINPSPTRQEQEITLKFFAPSHGFFAMLIGYGIVITAAALGKLAQKSRDSGDIVRILAVALCALCLAMPFVTYSRNRDLCSVSKFDFGYQFGYRMFNPGGGYPDMPENAVLYGGTDPGRFVPTYMIFCESFVKPEDRYVSPFLYTGTNATERAAETERMKAFDRRDVYIITQNALADKTYMNYIRDHYGHERPDPANEETLRKYMDWNDKKKQWEKTLQYHIFQWGWKSLGRDTTYPKEPIRIPTPKEGEAAFEEYVRDVQAGRRVDMGGISMEGGRMVVNGALAVMEINGILAKNIFDWNKDKHEFYIEESYPIQWMYPYLRPYGVILKIEKNPLPAPQRDKDGALTGLWKEIVDLDTSYWNAIEADFLARDEFLRNPDARKSFAKLRSAIAGVYLQRSMRIEAEYAYNQAVRLCPIGAPDSYFNNAKTGIGGSEAGGQLMEIYMRTGRFDEALKLAEQYAAYDPFNNGMVGRLEQVRRIIKLNDDTAELKRQIDTNPQNTTFQDLLTFISNSLELNKSMDAWGYGQLIITNANTSLPALPPALLRLGKLYGAHNRNDMALAAFRKYATLKPEDPVGWVESGWALICQNRLDDGYRMWEQALQIGGAPIARLIAGDQRMNSFLVQQPRDGRFIKLLESALSPPPPPKPQLPPGPYLPK